MKKTSKRTFLAFGLASFTIVAFLFSSCTPSDEKSSATKMNEANQNLIEAEADLNTAQKDYNQMYEAFKQESENRIAENEKNIAKLKAEIKNKRDKADLEKRLADLEKKNQTLKEKMQNYKDEGRENWEAFKTEFNHDMDNLGDALKDLTKRIQNKFKNKL